MVRSSGTQWGAPSVAIVTTLRDAGSILDSFITYHLAVGFERLFLFFDDPDDPSAEAARGHPGVVVTVNDRDLQNRWRRGAAYRENPLLRDFVNTEVMARQLLNVGLAVEMALELEIDWLLHIDSDELFYSPEATVGEHFQSLNDRGVMRSVYLNHEAVPRTADVTDCFREVTLFKKNPEAQQLFHFYSNGKSAARVRPGLLAPGVHGFRQPEELRWPSRSFCRMAWSKAANTAVKACPPLDDLRKVGAQRITKASTSWAPAILHYPCCGFESFWKKYQTLGSFPDTWFGRDQIAPRIGSFHLEARDVVAAGDRDAARSFYERRMVLAEQPVVDRLVDDGLLISITGPAALLKESRP